MNTLPTYRDWSPTPYDRRGAFLPERGDWLVLPVTRNRDSGPVDRSNFRAALEILGGESETVEVHRFRHWGPGWHETILVHPSRETDAQSIAERLESYPLLDEEDCSRREYDVYLESWEAWGRGDYWRGVCRELEGLSPEAESVLEGASSEEIDRFAEPAKHAVDWEYQPCGDGVSINLGGLVKASDLEAIAAWAEAEGFALRRRKDIARYCRAFRLPEPVIRRAVALNLDTFSAIAAICDP